MSLPDEFIGWCEGEIAKLRVQLAPLEAGTTNLGRRPAGGAWVDITQKEIATLKRAIADLEAVLAKRDDAPKPPRRL